MKQEIKTTCKNCGSENVEIRAWINQSNGNVSGETGEDNDTWCNDCEEHAGVNVEFIDVESKKFIENYLIGDVYPSIGIDKPENHDKIVEFILADIKETADPENWHSGDVCIAFRRFLESN